MQSDSDADGDGSELRLTEEGWRGYIAGMRERRLAAIETIQDTPPPPPLTRPGISFAQALLAKKKDEEDDSDDSDDEKEQHDPDIPFRKTAFQRYKDKEGSKASPSDAAKKFAAIITKGRKR